MITPEQAGGGSHYLLLLFPTINIVIVDETLHTASAASDCHNVSVSFLNLVGSWRWDGVMWTGLVWLMMGTGGELL
jgi:hypothetical protein